MTIFEYTLAFGSTFSLLMILVLIYNWIKIKFGSIRLSVKRKRNLYKKNVFNHK